MSYQPIENYGVIGNMRTVALVGINGSIDWLCFPHFDSPSIFAAILDSKKGGKFKIAPAMNGVTCKQIYWPDTNVLVSRFLSPDGVCEIIDYMPIITDNHSNKLIREVKVIRGSMKLHLECTPAFNYGRDDHTAMVSEKGAGFFTQNLDMGLLTHIPLKVKGKSVVAEFTLNEGQTEVFVLRELVTGQEHGICLTEDEEYGEFKNTVNYWRRWLSQCTYTGRWREMVHRSALVLKLLTFEPTGAVVAAPTCSLPEMIGGERNWDYRYTWIRDAAFTLYGLLRIGFTNEAANFMKWLEARCHDNNPDGSLQIMYGLDGSRVLTEETLDHFEGYKGSGPVRIGNEAYKQLQLDIYGELMDSVYLYNKYGTPISYDLWRHLRSLINWVCDHWQDKDEGIWEVRGGRQHFVYSKLMCWVALDRGIRLADRRSFPSDRNKWLEIRDKIYEEILSRGWNRKRQAFTQTFDSDNLDAANLIMPLIFFMSPNDPRMLKTLEAINRTPKQGGLVSNSLVNRYNIDTGGDGLSGDEGTFNICTFWLVEAMTRAGRTDPNRLDDARLMFEKMLGYANHLGLYSEEIGSSGESLGNFPQAFTHLALISAAFNLDKALGKG